MRVRPISPDLLVDELAERIAALPARRWQRVVVDGAPAARPQALADDLVEPLRLRGRPVLRVCAWDFLRPASVRLEHGHTDPDSYYEAWLDESALRREVLDPLDAESGTGRVLPTLWDAERDRATRAEYVTLPDDGVLLVDGALLLGRWLPVELTVHLALTPAALARRTPSGWAWTLPAYQRYEAEVTPAEEAGVAVRADDPRRPALVER